MYGPVCTVVWQGPAGNRRPYANPSVITSKPAIRYHFKTGQRDRTQDYMTLYRAARDSGKYFFD